jgi:DNA-directed RNA polymerase subunit RPC12/RpoP
MTDFIAYHDRTAADHQDHFDRLFLQGYRIISLSVYGVRGDERYAGVWLRRAGPDWSAIHGVDAAGFQAAFDKAAGGVQAGHSAAARRVARAAGRDRRKRPSELARSGYFPRGTPERTPRSRAPVVLEHPRHSAVQHACAGCPRYSCDMRRDLRDELLQRTERDQALRAMPEQDFESVVSGDADNLAWLKEIVNEVGWLGQSMVGEDGAHAAWLLAQHADQDPAFQRRCLELLNQAVASGEASPADLAYLTDRVLLADGKPQEYGTQFVGYERGWVPRRLRDPEKVDERRAGMGLGTLAENVALMAAEYGPPTPAIIMCPDCGSKIEAWPPEEGETRQVRCEACGFTSAFALDAPAEPPAGDDSA